jgi:hypothetical protein
MDKKTQIAQERWVQLYDKWEPEYQKHLECERKVASYFKVASNPPLDLIAASEFHKNLAVEIHKEMEKIIQDLDA